MLRMVVPSEPTFVSVLDPDSVPAQKQYGLARRIPPGEVERFFIAVVSKKSARFRVRLKFFVDKSTVLESELIEVALWRPTDSAPNIPDGDEIENESGVWTVRAKRYLGTPVRPTPDDRTHDSK